MTIDQQYDSQHNLYARANAITHRREGGSHRSGRRIYGGFAEISERIKAGYLRCRGLRSAGLDVEPAVAAADDDDEECKPMPGAATSPPICLSRSRDSFSARSRSSRFMIFFSRVLDIAPARRDSSALLQRGYVFVLVSFPPPFFFLIFLLFFYVRHTPPTSQGSPGSPHRRHAPDI